MNTVFLLKSIQKAEQEEAELVLTLRPEQRSGQSKDYFQFCMTLGKAHNFSVPQFPLRPQHYLLASSIFCKNFSINTSEMVGVPHEEDTIKVHITVKRQFVKNNSNETFVKQRKLKRGAVLFK